MDSGIATSWNYRSAGDLLDRLPGIWTRDLGLTGQHMPFRFAGAGTNQNLLLLDGEPIRDSWTGETDLTCIPVEMIEKIEIYPDINPFGVNPIGAAVNLISKQPVPKRPATTFLYRTAGNGFNDLDIRFSQQFFPGFTLSAGYSSLKFAENIAGLSFSGSTIRMDTRYNRSENLRFRYSLLSRTAEGETPYSVYLPDTSGLLTYPNRKLGNRDHRFNAFYRLASIENTLFMHLNTFTYEYRTASRFVQLPVNNLSIHFRQNLSGKPIALTWGLRVYRDNLDSETLATNSLSRESLYIQSAVRLTDGIGLSGNITAIHPQNGPGELTGAASISWQAGKNLKWGISAGRRLRMPTIGERSGFLLQPGPQETLDDAVLRSLETLPQANTDLKPETARSAALFAVWSPFNPFSMQTRLFYRQSKNLIALHDSGEKAFFSNRNEAEFYGLETRAHLGPVRHFSLNVVLNYLSATDQYDNVLLERPNVWGSAAVSWSGRFFEDDLTVNLELASLYRSQFWTAYGDGLFLTGLAGQILQSKATLTVMKHADVFLAFDNLLNTDLHRVYGFPIVGRTFRYGIRWTVFD